MFNILIPVSCFKSCFMNHESTTQFPQIFKPKTGSNPQPMKPKVQNTRISAYEMHVTKFTEDSTLRNYTYRGDKTLAFYKAIPNYAQSMESELAALLLKFQNSSRILDATIYDNTGNPVRVKIITIKNRVVTEDLTGNL